MTFHEYFQLIVLQIEQSDWAKLLQNYEILWLDIKRVGGTR